MGGTHRRGTPPQGTLPRSQGGAECVTGKSGRVVGHLMGFLLTLKGLPSTYNKDMQAPPPDSPPIAHPRALMHARTHGPTAKTSPFRPAVLGSGCTGLRSSVGTAAANNTRHAAYAACGVRHQQQHTRDTYVRRCPLRSARWAAQSLLRRRTRSRCLTSSISSRFDTVAPRRAYA